MSVSPGADRFIRRHPSPPKPKPAPAPPPAPTPVVAQVPSPPAGWEVTYTHNFAHTAGLADWVLQPGNNAPVADHDTPGSEFGLGIQITAESQWSELISKDAVVGPSSFVQALIFVPLTATGAVANWPAWWTTGPNWPEDGEIDIFEGLGGSLTLSTHYGTLDPTTNYASENQQAPVAPPHTGNWLTVTLLRQNEQVTVWYGNLKVGPIPAPFTENHVLIFQNQSYSTSVCPNCFGPYAAGTAYLSNVSVWAPKS